MHSRKITAQEALERLASLAEDRNLSLNGSLNWESSPENVKAQVARDGMALTNSGGGWIVFGARPGELSGISKEDSASFSPEAINSYFTLCWSMETPVKITRLVIPGNTEKIIVILCVPEFSDEPAVCRRDVADSKGNPVIESGAIYLRSTDGKTSKLSDQSQMRRLIRDAVAKRVRGLGLEIRSEKEFFEEISLAREYFLQNAGCGFDKGYWEFSAHPLTYEPDRIELFELSALFEDARMPEETFWFFKPEEFEVFQKGVQYHTHSAKSMECARLYKSGLFIWRAPFREDFGITEEEGSSGETVLRFDSALELITRFFLFAGHFYPSVDIYSGIRIEINMRKMKGRRLVSSSFLRADANAVCGVDDVEMARIITPGDVRLSHKNAADIGFDIAALFNWRDHEDAHRAVIKIVEAVAAYKSPRMKIAGKSRNK